MDKSAAEGAFWSPHALAANTGEDVDDTIRRFTIDTGEDVDDAIRRFKIHAGEDVLEKILQFARPGPAGVCILSASGFISAVCLREFGSSDNYVTYYGCFKILNIWGYCIVEEKSNRLNETGGGFVISVENPEGDVICGELAGELQAHDPFKVVIGRFIPAMAAESSAETPRVKRLKT